MLRAHVVLPRPGGRLSTVENKVTTSSVGCEHPADDDVGAGVSTLLPPIREARRRGRKHAPDVHNLTSLQREKRQIAELDTTNDVDDVPHNKFHTTTSTEHFATPEPVSSVVRNSRGRYTGPRIVSEAFRSALRDRKAAAILDYAKSNATTTATATAAMVTGIHQRSIASSSSSVLPSLRLTPLENKADSGHKSNINKERSEKSFMDTMFENDTLRTIAANKATAASRVSAQTPTPASHELLGDRSLASVASNRTTALSRAASTTHRHHHRWRKVALAAQEAILEEQSSLRGFDKIQCRLQQWTEGSGGHALRALLSPINTSCKKEKEKGTAGQ